MGYKDIDLFLLLFFNEVPFTIYTLMPEIKMALKWGQFQTDETHTLHKYFSTKLELLHYTRIEDKTQNQMPVQRPALA